MRTLLLLAALSVVPSARADISDPGSLTLGGNGVIGGTVTIQGGAFSIGGSSFTITGGSATVAYQLAAASFSGNGAGLTGVTASSSIATVNGSMLGDGTALNPLGVISSSIAVLSGGLVLDSQIDASSVTKQGNSFNGASQLVKADINIGVSLASMTLTATGASAYDLTLSSGVRFLASATGITWADGSTSTTSSSGGGTCSNCLILNSSQTVSGNNVFTATMTVSGNFVGDGKVTNSTYVWTNPAIAGTFTTSAEGPCVKGSSMSITSNGNNIILTANMPAEANGGATSAVSCMFLRDGGYPLNTVSGTTACEVYSGGSSATQITVTMYDKPPAGKHTYCFTVWDAITSQSLVTNGIAFFGASENQ